MSSPLSDENHSTAYSLKKSTVSYISAIVAMAKHKAVFFELEKTIIAILGKKKINTSHKLESLEISMSRQLVSSWQTKTEMEILEV